MFLFNNVQKNPLKAKRDLVMLYDNVLARFGSGSSCSLNWESHERQMFNFNKLAKWLRGMPNPADHFSILDVGCGLGDLAAFLSEEKFSFSYVGCDISEKMISEAAIKHPAANYTFYAGDVFDRKLTDYSFDYCVALGTFAFKFGSTSSYLHHFKNTVEQMYTHALKGIFFDLFESRSLARLQSKMDLAFLAKHFSLSSSELKTILNDIAFANGRVSIVSTRISTIVEMFASIIKHH